MSELELWNGSGARELSYVLGGLFEESERSQVVGYKFWANIPSRKHKQNQATIQSQLHDINLEQLNDEFQCSNIGCCFPAEKFSLLLFRQCPSSCRCIAKSPAQAASH
jgi:lipoate synthase